jgi:DNA-binding response OmpR family regulator
MSVTRQILIVEDDSALRASLAEQITLGGDFVADLADSAKPFRLPELLARIRAQIRLYDASEDAVFTVGPYQFRPSARLLLEPIRNRKIRLTYKECSLLKCLYHAGGKPVPRPMLLDEVWGYNAVVETHTLETHVYRLRQKIEADPAKPHLLQTESGSYKLTAAATATSDA